MPPITMYTSPFCPYCYMAKRLLKDKGAAFEEIDVMMHPKQRADMVTRSAGRNTVPQIFIGDMHVGGCDDLMALDQAGKLAPLLEDAA